MQTFLIEQRQISSENFDVVADILLNQTILSINSVVYRICEIEFYLNSENHPDKYTHSLEQQKEHGKYYFHRFKNGSYKSGTFKCMDFAIGNSRQYCGILLRSMCDILTGEFIEGPCLCVNRILQLCQAASVADLDGLSMLENNAKFIVQNFNCNKEQIYRGFRVGLKNTYSNFFEKKYRYLIMKNKIKKSKKSLEPVF